jgi:hypothetical protein
MAADLKRRVSFAAQSMQILKINGRCARVGHQQDPQPETLNRKATSHWRQPSKQALHAIRADTDQFEWISGERLVAGNT